MKRFISLLLTLVMICAVTMSVSAATPSVALDMVWGTYAEETDMMTGETTWKASGFATSAAAGDKIIAMFRATANCHLANIDFKANYDSSILTYVKGGLSAGTVAANETSTGVVEVSYGTTDYAATGMKVIYAMVFEVKQNPTKSLDSIIDIEVKGSENAYYANGTTKTTFSDSDVSFSAAEIEITGLQEETKDFTVTAVDNGTDTVVTVANKGDNAGTVYVATYTDQGVLVKCARQALADDDLTFTGLTGNVKVFVWGADNVPLLASDVVVTTASN